LGRAALDLLAAVLGADPDVADDPHAARLPVTFLLRIVTQQVDGLQVPDPLGWASVTGPRTHHAVGDARRPPEWCEGVRHDDRVVR
jgi:hypothetical protein